MGLPCHHVYILIDLDAQQGMDAVFCVRRTDAGIYPFGISWLRSVSDKARESFMTKCSRVEKHIHVRIIQL